VPVEMLKKSTKKVPQAKKKKRAQVALSWVGNVVEVNLTMRTTCGTTPPPISYQTTEGCFCS